jgi:hypothetical protein
MLKKLDEQLHWQLAADNGNDVTLTTPATPMPVARARHWLVSVPSSKLWSNSGIQKNHFYRVLISRFAGENPVPSM